MQMQKSARGRAKNSVNSRGACQTGPGSVDYSRTSGGAGLPARGGVRDWRETGPFDGADFSIYLVFES